MKLVLCSGGVDSLVCAERARAAGELAGCVFVDYAHPARHAEHLKVLAYCNARGAPFKRLQVLNLALGGMSAEAWVEGTDGVTVTACCQRTGRDFETNGHQADCPGNARVVPSRNAVLLSLAANVAPRMGATRLVYGANAADHRSYPDCRAPFLLAMGRALGIPIEAPLLSLNKAEIIKEAQSYGLTRADTWSCYGSGSKECGRCASCVEAQAAWESEK